MLSERMREANVSANRLAQDIRIPTNRITMTIRGERNITADTALRLAAELSAPRWEAESVRLCTQAFLSPSDRIKRALARD